MSRWIVWRNSSTLIAQQTAIPDMHIRSQHLDLLQHCYTIADFKFCVNQMHRVVFTGNALHVRSRFRLYVPVFTELNLLSVGSQLAPQDINLLIDCVCSIKPRADPHKPPKQFGTDFSWSRQTTKGTHFTVE
ncbi:TPA: hypothetical protein ACH3X1_011591 [Trebouxia sp. C0004]